MGAGVSNWRLAHAVSIKGQLGVVAGTALDYLMARRLEDGDAGGHIRRALDHFPFQGMVRKILDAHFIPGGKSPDSPYRTLRMHRVDEPERDQELCVAANFVEIFLAREGHDGPIGINFLEKIQIPHLPSMYGAMLAGVAVVIVGAGIPLEFPDALDALSLHRPASYSLNITGTRGETIRRASFDPSLLSDGGPLPHLVRPSFFPIVSSTTLATAMARRCGPGALQGFIVEGPRAGGHNAPPRGAMKLTSDGQPIYGPRDAMDMDTLRSLGLPFWMAGSFGSPERMRDALAMGASGIQVGTPFALCTDSGLAPDIRRMLVLKALSGNASVFTDPKASPTGFPFKVAELENTLSQADVYNRRRRICDLGFLREPYLREDNTIGYRCPAEPPPSFLAKGGSMDQTEGRKCLCNALVANIGMPQRLADGSVELPLVTLGDDYTEVARFCRNGNPDFSAADVIDHLLST